MISPSKCILQTSQRLFNWLPYHQNFTKALGGEKSVLRRQTMVSQWHGFRLATCRRSPIGAGSRQWPPVAASVLGANCDCLYLRLHEAAGDSSRRRVVKIGQICQDVGLERYGKIWKDRSSSFRKDPWRKGVGLRNNFVAQPNSDTSGGVPISPAAVRPRKDWLRKRGPKNDQKSTFDGYILITKGKIKKNNNCTWRCIIVYLLDFIGRRTRWHRSWMDARRRRGFVLACSCAWCLATEAPSCSGLTSSENGTCSSIQMAWKNPPQKSNEPPKIMEKIDSPRWCVIVGL